MGKAGWIQPAGRSLRTHVLERHRLSQRASSDVEAGRLCLEHLPTLQPMQRSCTSCFSEVVKATQEKGFSGWGEEETGIAKENCEINLILSLSTGGQYLSVSEPKGKAGRVARLVLPLGHLAHAGDLCLSFRHKVSGLHSGLLQVFVRKTGVHGPAVWGRNGGHGWRQTQIKLQGSGLKSVIFKGEKGKGRTGEIALDDDRCLDWVLMLKPGLERCFHDTNHQENSGRDTFCHAKKLLKVKRTFFGAGNGHPTQMIAADRVTLSY
ncbi:Nephronectin [Varanus komodoensis]|nr:Nephronectin [Varanus komodoensis]